MIKLVIALILFTFPSISQADQYVHGYQRHDGTYVDSYYRSSPNSTVTDNYSYKGNSNPYNGQTGDNYYRNSPTSQYYGSSSNNNSGNSNGYFGSNGRQYEY